MMSSRYSKIAALLLVLSMLAIPNLFSQIEYKSLLTGRNEVMPVLTPATGSILATLTGNELVITGEFQQLSGTVLEDGANIHLGMAGQEGAVILGLIPSLNEAQTGGTFNAGLNTFSLGQEQIDLLAARELYINITTTAFESGEIRGQLLPDALTYFDANLLGSNEVPAVNSFGSGHVTIELVSATQIAVSGSFNNLGSDFDASIGAHLHIGSVGENGDVVFPLTPQVTADNRSGVFNAADNTFDIDFNQLLAIGERKIYANVHSLNHPGGELRGQFVPAEASAVFRAKLSGSQAVPVQTSLAEGVAMAEIYGDTLMIVSGSFKDLDSPIVTTNTSNRPGLYAGFAGEDGGFLFPLNLSSAVSGLNGEIEASNNVFLLDNTQASRLYERGIYVNLASETQSNGALRGQFVPESQIVLHGFMSGTLAVPPSNSVGHGNLVAELNENNLTFSGSFQELDGLPGRPSLNIGYAGSTGEQIFSFTADENNIRATDNSFDLSDEQMEALMARQFYVNLPSSAQSSGELRAQILPEATTYFVGTLSGASQTEAVNTTAYGQVILEYTNGVASLTGSFDGLESDFNINAAGGVHIYNGFAGSNGEIVQRLNVSLNDENRGGVFEATANTFNLEAAATNDLIERGEYVSIVTNDQVNGAIRGQLLPFANAYFTTTLSAFNTLPLPVNSDAIGALKAELRGNELTITGSANDLSANLEASSTQFYLGRAGMSGEAQFELSQTLSDDSRSVTYLAANNTYRLDDVQIRNLKRDRQHVAITNTTYPEGELRGQMLAEPNYAPNGATTIIEPANGESLIIEGDPTGMFRLSWDPATDESDLYYVIQSSEFEDFRTFENKGVLAGFDNTLLYSVEIMDSILMAEGLEVGESIQQHYRFVACDGALNTPGAASLLTYTRGEVETVSGADLELFITGPTGAYEQFSEIPYQISVINRGGQNARNIFVSAPLPAGMVFTSAEPSVGDYNLFFGWWNIDVLNAGDTAVLDLTLFTLEEEEAITNYVQIIGAQPADPDSRPNNGVAPEPREDDEAAFTIFSEPTVRGGTTADLSLTLETVEDEFTVFSNTTYVLTLMNEGPDSAANIRVSALIPQGMVFTSA
ncbi:MAG: CHRD domain-containing protein, partial [Bacteroidota bacterium]